MSRKEFDFTSRKKTEVPYSDLRHNLDTRANGSQDIDFVTKELLPSYEDVSDALDGLLKFPIEITGDGTIVVGRNQALAIKILLGEENPKIPVEVYNDIPNFEKLDDEDQLRVRTYAIAKDHVKTRQRGLKDADYLFNVQTYVDAGWTNAQISEALPMLKEWRLTKLRTKAKQIRTQRALLSARAEISALTKAKKPVNFTRIAERYGVRETELTSPTRRGGKTAALNSLKAKQRNLSHSQRYIDGNFEWYTQSAQGTLATSDCPSKMVLSAQTFGDITRHHREQARRNLTLWDGAVARADNQIERLEKQRQKAGAGRK